MNEETKDAQETQGIKRPWAPGPWVIHENNRLVAVGGGREVGRATTDDWLTSDEEKANARLIAAAPELFEALVLLIDDVELFVPSNHIKSVDQARATLAKALGGQP